MIRNATMLALAYSLSIAAAPAKAERLVLASASYGKNVMAICTAQGQVLWSHTTAGPRTGHAGHHDIQLLDNGNILFHEDWTTILEMTLDRRIVWKYDSSTMNGNQGKRVEVHAFRRLPNGLTMIAESGVGRIIEVDRAGRIQAEVKLKPGATQHTRLVRKLPTGNYLVCAENPGVVTEYNAQGEVVWEHPVGARVYGAIRLHNVNTLIASGGGAGVLEVTPDHKIAWEIKDRVPDTTIALKWTTFLTELDNGHFVVGNCHAGENSPQLFEIAKDKKIVWQFNRFDFFGNGLACSQVLTDGESAHVRKKLADLSPGADEQYGVPRTRIAIGKHAGFLLQPPRPASDGTRPWVWYAPTIGKYPNESNAWLLRQLLDRGFYVAGVDVGESYGSPAGRKVFTDFYHRVVRDYQLEPKARLLAQSRGGLMIYNWAAENPEKVHRIAGIYPVCDLRSYPGLVRAAPAYEMTSVELEKQLTQHNPIDRLQPLAKAGVPILHVHGDADRVVPLERNSQVVRERYDALGGKMKLIVVAGKGHAEIPDYFQEPQLLRFLAGDENPK
jgi:pimeloyl-ACP methyl ester carboxylesterase